MQPPAWGLSSSPVQEKQHARNADTVHRLIAGTPVPCSPTVRPGMQQGAPRSSLCGASCFSLPQNQSASTPLATSCPHLELYPSLRPPHCHATGQNHFSIASP
jgi:hypothetical protein